MRYSMRQWGIIFGLVGMFGSTGSALGARETTRQAGIPPETVADYIYAVLQADRTFYTVHLVERMQSRGVIGAAENWRSSNALPLPAQFFQEASKLAALTGVKVRYKLISLWPINKQSGPANEFEHAGLEAVLKEPDKPYRNYMTEGGTRYFQALYADRAVSKVCVECHNAHPSSIKRDFKLNDVMGGVVITLPVGE